LIRFLPPHAFVGCGTDPEAPLQHDAAAPSCGGAGATINPALMNSSSGTVSQV